MLDVPYVTFGIYWCPVCCQRREFVSYDEGNRKPEDAECFACGHVFGRKTDEAVVEETIPGDPTSRRYKTVVSPVLSDETVRKARARRLEEWEASALSSGVRREVLRRATGNATDQG